MAGRQSLLMLVRRWRWRQRSLHWRWQQRTLMALVAALALLIGGGSLLIDAAVEEEEGAWVAAVSGPMLGTLDRAAERLQLRAERWLEWHLSHDGEQSLHPDLAQLAAMGVDHLWLWQGQQLLTQVGDDGAQGCRLRLLAQLRGDGEPSLRERRGVMACDGRWWLFVMLAFNDDRQQPWWAAVTRPLRGSLLLDSGEGALAELSMLAPASLVASGLILASDELAGYGALGVERIGERLRIRVTPTIQGQARQRLAAGGDDAFALQVEVAREHAGRMLALGYRLLLLGGVTLLGLLLAIHWISGRQLLLPLLMFSRQLRRLSYSPQVMASLAPLLQRLLQRSFNRLTAMAEQQRFSAQVVESIRDLILITDGDGGVRHLNPAACDFLGLSAAGEASVMGIPVDLLLLVEGGCTTSLSHQIARALAAGRTLSCEVLLRARSAPAQQVSGRMVIYPMTAVRSGSGAVVLISLSDTVCLLDPLAEANPAGAAATGR